MGSYTLTITISVGTAGFVSTQTHAVSLTLVNPCPGSTIDPIDHSSIPAMSTYSLRNIALTMIDYSSISITRSTPADCGVINKVFSELTVPDMTPFTDDVPNQKFIVNYS